MTDDELSETFCDAAEVNGPWPYLTGRHIRGLRAVAEAAVAEHEAQQKQPMDQDRESGMLSDEAIIKIAEDAGVFSVRTSRAAVLAVAAAVRAERTPAPRVITPDELEAAAAALSKFYLSEKWTDQTATWRANYRTRVRAVLDTLGIACAQPELAPCPFCGIGELSIADNGVWWVECTDCAATGPTRTTKEQAVADWNVPVRDCPGAAPLKTQTLYE